jgi:hypothetical protein
VQTAEMLDLPRPALEGGKAQTVACPMSDEQKELQAGLSKRPPNPFVQCATGCGPAFHEVGPDLCHGR